MSKLTYVVKTMSSLEIAKLCNKEHRNVMADIRNMLKDLNLSTAEFSAVYKAENGQEYECFNLPKRETLILVSGYDIVKRAQIIDRWQELENQQPVIAKPKKERLGHVHTIAKGMLSMAKAFGLQGNQAILSADKATRKLTGESPLELLDITHLHAPVQQMTFTPTQLGQQLTPSISAIKVNVLLSDLGLQEKVNDTWLPTDKGNAYAEVLDTGKKHSNGTPVKQVKWYSGIVDLLEQHHKPHLQVV